MQSTSYSGHHYSGDQTRALNGISCRGSRDSNFLFQPPKIEQCLNYKKGLLREMMPKNEAAFRYQMYEMHRLYGRQRELMDGMQMNKPPARCFMPQVPMQQKIPSWLFSGPQYGERQGVENFRSPSAFVQGNIHHVSSVQHHTVKSDFKQPESSSSGKNKSRKRILDLELPAEVYLDSDDEEQVEEKRISQIHPVLHSPSINHVAVSREGTSINSSSRHQRRRCVFDLNDPVQADELIVSKSPMPSSMISRKIKQEDHGVLKERGKPFSPGHQLSGKWPFSCNERVGLSSEVARHGQNLVDSSKRRCLALPMSTSSSVLPYSVDADAKRLFDKPRDDPKVVIQALPCFTASALNGISSASSKRVRIKEEINAGYRSFGSNSSRASCETENHFANEGYCAAKSSLHSDCKKTRIDLDLNDMPSDFSPETEACQENVEFSNGGLNLDLNVVPDSSSSETGVSDKHVESMDGNNNVDKSGFDGKMIDLNSKLLEHISSSSQLSALTSVTSASSSSEFEPVQKLEKSAIPSIVAMPNCNNDEKVKESTVSDGVEKGLEAPVSPDKNELEKIAAETIVSMSLSWDQHCLENSINWFAGIVSSVAGNAEDEFGAFKSPGPRLRQRGQWLRNAGQQEEMQTRDRKTRKPGKTVKGGRNVDVAKNDEARGKRARSGSKKQQQQLLLDSHGVDQSWLFVWGKRSRRQKHKRVQK